MNSTPFLLNIRRFLNIDRIIKKDREIRVILEVLEVFIETTTHEIKFCPKIEILEKY